MLSPNSNELTRFLEFLALQVKHGAMSVEDHKSIIDAGILPLAHAGTSDLDEIVDPSIDTVFGQCLHVMKLQLQRNHPELFQALIGRDNDRSL